MASSSCPLQAIGGTSIGKAPPQPWLKGVSPTTCLIQNLFPWNINWGRQMLVFTTRISPFLLETITLSRNIGPCPRGQYPYSLMFISWEQNRTFINQFFTGHTQYNSIGWTTLTHYSMPCNFGISWTEVYAFYLLWEKVCKSKENTLFIHLVIFCTCVSNDVPNSFSTYENHVCIIENLEAVEVNYWKLPASNHC